jgi:bifunctional non-homologous end joining protein LigD
VGTGFITKHYAIFAPGSIESKATRRLNLPRGADARGVHWIKPVLVCETGFTNWTSVGLLRHPSFKGRREDKPAGQVKRKIASAARTRAPITSFHDVLK